jgi:branched-chain amino acid transport system substrate-binding protein
MHRRTLLKTGVAALAVSLAASAQESVKIGLILPMTGGQASTGKQIDNAVKLYMQQKGDTVACRKIEIILKDDGAVPDKTKRIAQELIVNERSRSRALADPLALRPLATQARCRRSSWPPPPDHHGGLAVIAHQLHAAQAASRWPNGPRNG